MHYNNRQTFEKAFLYFFFEHMVSKDLNCFWFGRIEKVVSSLFPFRFYSYWGLCLTVEKKKNKNNDFIMFKIDKNHVS